jgi:hypothetical protein
MLFIEIYTFDRFNVVNIDNEVETRDSSTATALPPARVAFVQPGAGRINIAGTSIDDIKGFEEANLARNDRFLWVPIRNVGGDTTKYLLRDIEGEVEGIILDFDSESLIMDGTVYRESAVNKVDMGTRGAVSDYGLDTAAGVRRVRINEEPPFVYTLYLFNGRVMEIELVTATLNYAIVLAVREAGGDGWGGDRPQQVRLLLSDGTTIERNAPEGEDYEELVDELVSWNYNRRNEVILRTETFSPAGFNNRDNMATLTGREVWSPQSFGALARPAHGYLPASNLDATFEDDTVFFIRVNGPNNDDRRPVWRVFNRNDVPTIRGGTIPASNDPEQVIDITYGFRDQLNTRGNVINAMSIVRVASAQRPGVADNGPDAVLMPRVVAGRSWAISLGTFRERIHQGNPQIGLNVLRNGTTAITLWQDNEDVIENGGDPSTPEDPANWTFSTVDRDWTPLEASEMAPGLTFDSFEEDRVWFCRAIIDISARGAVFEYILEDGLLKTTDGEPNAVPAMNMGANILVHGSTPMMSWSLNPGSPLYYRGVFETIDDGMVVTDDLNTSFEGAIFIRIDLARDAGGTGNAGEISLATAQALERLDDDYHVFMVDINWSDRVIIFMQDGLAD